MRNIDEFENHQTALAHGVTLNMAYLYNRILLKHLCDSAGTLAG